MRCRRICWLKIRLSSTTTWSQIRVALVVDLERGSTAGRRARDVVLVQERAVEEEEFWLGFTEEVAEFYRVCIDCRPFDYESNSQKIVA